VVQLVRLDDLEVVVEILGLLIRETLFEECRSEFFRRNVLEIDLHLARG
jgi:hypothetical protein